MLINEILIEDVIEDDDLLCEGAVRQMRRYGSKMKMQYRCQGGDKDGRLVSKPSECSIRKNPNKVRAGQHSSRIKKGQRVRKTQFTKRKTLSQILVRRNKMMKGATADTVSKDNPKTNSDTIKSTGTVGTS